MANNITKHKFTKMKFLTIFLVYFIFAKFTLAADQDDVNSSPEPAFPQLFDPTSSDRSKIHIVSEWIDHNLAQYETSEEFVNIKAGKSLFIVENKKGRESKYIDAKHGFVYRYRPYTCSAINSNVILTGFEGIWNALVKFRDVDTNVAKEMHIYGVAAIWLNAALKPKTYSLIEQVFNDTSTSYHRRAHRWSISDEAYHSKVHLYFIKRHPNSLTLTLDMIQFESNKTKEITKTLNVLSYDSLFNGENRYMLEVPIGYGCADARAEIEEGTREQLPWSGSVYVGNDAKDVEPIQPMKGWTKIEPNFLFPMQQGSYRIHLQATATKFGESSSGRAKTVVVELARASTPLGRGQLKLIKRRSEKDHIKIVSNNVLGVKYEIDLQQGECQISNLSQSEDEDFVLEFGDDLKLDLSQMDQIFVGNDEFRFVKSIKKSLKSNLEYHYFEKTSKKFIPSKLSRIVREYSSQSGVLDKVRLERVTIWVLDQERKQMLESYSLDVIETEVLEKRVEIAKTFDISDECYLNNERMRVGRDYVWFKLYYPLSAEQSEMLISLNDILKALIWDGFKDYASLDFYRVPRLEVMFEDSEFVLRALLIDIPSLHYLYTFSKGRALKMFKDRGDMEDLAVNLEHCADLCRLNRCRAMSYCDQNHRCLLSSRKQGNIGEGMTRDSACNSYTLSSEKSVDVDDLLDSSLNRILGLFKSIDFSSSSINLPPIPEELSLPRSETGLDQATYDEELRKYLDDLKKVNQTDARRSRMFNIPLSVEHYLTFIRPNRFELEQDPLREFDLIDNDPQADEEISSEPLYHEGLAMHRFKISNNQEGNNMQLFNGINYEQCTLICQDNSCSSFSYCSHRQECITTDIYNISDTLEKTIIEVDYDCFIAQRDFLSKFNKFSNVFRPQIYERSSKALNPSECAHNCIFATDFKCLAFDYCEPSLLEGKQKQRQLDSCFYLQERVLFTGASESMESEKIEGIKSSSALTGCDHYSRSYLADFIRIEHRRILGTQLEKFKTTLIKGKSVDQCAEICANQLLDCTAFQFCFDSEAGGAKQSCLMIEGRPQDEDNQDYEAVVNSTSNGSVVSTGKFFVSSYVCHMFALRKDTSEALSRDLAIKVKELDEPNEELEQNGLGISVGGAILLYFLLTSISTVIVFGVFVAKEHHNYASFDTIRRCLG